MSAAVLARVIGRTGRWRVRKGLTVAVVVRDARQSFGRVDYLIEPDSGEGRRWVNASSVELDEDQK